MLNTIEKAAATSAFVALDACVRTLVLAAIAAAAVRILRTSRASAQLQVWSFILITAVLMPGLTQALPEWTLPVPSWMASNDVQPAELRVPVVVNHAAIATPQHEATPAVSPSFTTSPPSVDASERARIDVWKMLGIVVYIAGAAVLILQLLIGWRAIGRLTRRSTVVRESNIVELFKNLSLSSGLARTPRLLETSALSVPVTLGIVRPAVVLPRDWREWSSGALHAVFVHELAHVARRDAIRQLASLLYRALLWVNPFSWWLHRKLVDLAEQASDDAAIEAGADRIEYAEMLVGFSRAAATSRRANWSIAMATGASVEKRVDRVISEHAEGRARHQRQFGFVLLIPIACLAASAMPVAVAVPPALVAPSQPDLVLELPPPSHTVAPHTVGPVRLMSSPRSEIPASLPTAITPQPAVPQGAMPVPQMTVLLFDLAVPSGARQRAIGAAQRQISETMTRFSAGLDYGMVWRVATVGSQVEILQDFTGDMEKVSAALARASTLTTSSTNNPERLASIAGMCRGVAALPADDSYFQDWPDFRKKLEIGTVSPMQLDSSYRRVELYATPDTLTPDERQRAQQACQFGNLIYRTVLVEGATPHTPPAPQAPALQREVLHTRSTTLIFDGMPREADRARSVHIANRIVDELGPAETVSIVAAGATPELQQDFTPDKSLLRAALARAASFDRQSSPLAGFIAARRSCAAAAGRLEASAANLESLLLSRMRDAQTPPGSITLFRGDDRVIFFSTAVERGLIAPRDLRDLAAKCSDARRGFLILDAGWISPVYGADGPVSPGLRQLGYDLGVGLALASRQSNCPVTLASENVVLDTGFASVRISNGSQQPVRTVTFGVVVTPNDPSPIIPKVLTSSPVNVLLKAGENTDIATRVLDGKLLALLSLQGAIAELGVVGVEFADGTKWTYDLKTRGAFERQNTPDSARGLFELLSQRSTSPAGVVRH